MQKNIQVNLITILAFSLMWIMPLPAVAALPVPEKRPIIVGVTDHPYDVELTRAIAREMDLKVQFKVLPADVLAQALKNGEIDVLTHAAYTESRTKIFDFSPSYQIMNMALFGRENSPLLSSIKDWHEKDVMVCKGQSISEIVKEEGWKSITCVDSYEEMIRLLSSGKHDYAILNARIAIDHMRLLGIENITIISPEPIVLHYCFAVKKGKHDMLAPFIRGLAILHKTGEDERINLKWFGGDLEPQRIRWKQLVRYSGIIVLTILAVLGTIFIWSLILRKQVAQRTAELSLEIRERKRAEDELRSNQENLVQAEKMAAIGTLVSGVAHEINNPNGLILMNVTTLSMMHEDIRRIIDLHYEEKGDFEVGKWWYSEVKECIGQMMNETIDASKRIVRIVEDLKNYSRRGDSALNEAVNLNSVAEYAIRLVHAAIKKYTDSFIVRYAENLPEIKGNSQRIEQVIVNLILNACQALPDRGKGIELKTRYDMDNQTVVLEIKDEGIGIAPEHLKNITDPFYTTKREQGGTGLGLSVSSIIVKEHGGFLAFDSVEGKGTTVTVSFPVA